MRRFVRVTVEREFVVGHDLDSPTEFLKKASTYELNHHDVHEISTGHHQLPWEILQNIPQLDRLATL